MPISRRDILKSLTMTAVTGSVLRVIPLEAAEYAHRMVRAEKAAAENQVYTPKFFSAHYYKTLQTLCQTIIPADGDAKGAIEAGAPEFIDLITSENKDYQVALGGGLMWLDNTCIDRYGKRLSRVHARAAERNPRPHRLPQERQDKIPASARASSFSASCANSPPTVSSPAKSASAISATSATHT